MSSGTGRRIVINTQERAVSTDINRAQAFAGQDRDELLRYLLDVTGSDDIDSGGVVVEPSTVETPLRAEVINGLLVRPQVGSFNLLVDPGVLMAMAPDGTADESNYKLVRDPGITVLGTLTMATNGAGSPRIDVVEVQVNATPNIVTDNRDIFNAVTNLFAASVVTKETKAQLVYRVRQGVAGAGMPANQAGWLPLCVASVPPAAASNDAITFWDVRPLVSDRARGVSALSIDYPLVEKQNWTIDDRANIGVNAFLRGSFSGTVNSRRVGGRFRRGTPGSDVAISADLLDAANQEPGFAFPATGFYYVYLATPFGLPRWARYADAPAARQPRSPRGIAVVSAVAPQHMTGKPSAGIQLPTSTGLGGSTTDALCVAAPYAVVASNIYGGFNDGKVFYPSRSFGPSIAATTNTSSRFTGNLVEGTTHPANAKAIWVQFTLSLTIPANSATQWFNGNILSVSYPGAALGLANPTQFHGPDMGTFVNADVNPQTIVTAYPPIRIPLYPQYPDSLVGGTKILDWNYDQHNALYGAAVTAGSCTAQVVGWEL